MEVMIQIMIFNEQIHLIKLMQILIILLEFKIKDRISMIQAPNL